MVHDSWDIPRKKEIEPSLKGECVWQITRAQISSILLLWCARNAGTSNLPSKLGMLYTIMEAQRLNWGNSQCLSLEALPLIIHIDYHFSFSMSPSLSEIQKQLLIRSDFNPHVTTWLHNHNHKKAAQLGVVNLWKNTMGLFTFQLPPLCWDFPFFFLWSFWINKMSYCFEIHI